MIAFESIPWSREAGLPRPACGERSDGIADAIRVRGPLRESNAWIEPPPPTLSPRRAGRGRSSPACLRRFGRFRLLRTGIEALGVDIAVDEFDHRHRRVVAVAEAGLDDAGVAALPVLVADRQRVEQLLGLVEIAHLGDRLAAHREA